MLTAEVGGGARLVWREQRRAVGSESLAVAATPEALVGDHDGGRRAAQEVGEWLVLLLVGRHDRVAERHAAAVREQDEPHPVDESVLRLGETEAGKAGELAPLRASRIVGDAD